LSFGCCFGRPTSLPVGIRYENPMSKAARQARLQGVPIHPVPLYEALYNVALFLFLIALTLGGAREGAPTAFYLVLYGAGRFGLESLRYSTESDKMGPLLRNQWLSLAMIVPGLVLLPQHGSAPTLVAPDPWELLALVPVLVASSFIVFLAYSIHRRELGRW
ncbi:MAG: prolipoprotein diacylglyceryl transferase family protein, partial [Chloroflexota bacterium]